MKYILVFAVTTLVILLASSRATAQTNLYSEGFEFGWDGWSADNGVWQVGVPTGGPGNAHSGTNCAGTVLAGTGIPDYTSSRLVSPAVALSTLGSGQQLQVRFWQWYSAGDGVSGEVQVSVWTNGAWGAWITLATPVQPGNSASGGWSLGQADLTAYAGQFVRIAFYHINTSSWVVPGGWFVDDVQIWRGVPNFNNPQGFEQGWGDWYAENGVWQVGVPTGGPATNSLGWRAHGGTNCAGTVLTGTGYPAHTSSRLISPTFTLPTATGPGQVVLNWWGWFSFGSYASGQIQISVWSNGVWNAWVNVGSSSGSSGGWSPGQADLYAYGGQTVRIAFDHTDSNNWGGTGWFVDDVSILNYVSPPLINQPPTNQTVNLESPVTFVVGASGAGTLSYQWQFRPIGVTNSSSIFGATNTSYFIPSAELTNGGYYSVIVSNSGGATPSTEALLTVLPLPWSLTNDVVNPIALPGTVGYTNGVFTVTGSGEDIQGTADAFEFVHQTLVGDGQIVARVTSLIWTNDSAAEAGVMIRESLAAGSTYAFLRVNPEMDVVYRRRLATDAYSIDTAYSPTNRPWLCLMRMGNTFIAHCSTNGVNWEYVWFTTVNMSNQVQIGLAVTSHHNGSYATATLDNVSIGSLSPLPGTWPLPGPKILLGGEAGAAAEFQRVGGLKFLVGGVVGDQFSVKCSTNTTASLASWQALGTVTNTYGVVPFIDSQLLTNRMRFYRAQRTGP